MTVLRTQLAGVARRPARMLLTGLSVLVAAFVVFGTVIAHQITIRTTLDTFSGTPAATDLALDASGAHDTSGASGRLTAGTLAAVRAVPGVADAVGRWDNLFEVTSSAGTYLRITADPGAGPQTAVRVIAGRYPNGPHQLALTGAAAHRLGTSPGGTLALRPTGNDRAEPVSVAVTGIVDGPSGSPEQAYAPDTIAAGLASQVPFHRIDIHRAPGASRQAVTDRLQAVAPHIPVVEGASIRAEEATEKINQIDDLYAIVAMFVAVAIVAAVLVATSTFRIVFAQRMRQLALLRAVGAGRGQLIRALAAEGALTGLVTGVLGVAGAAVAGAAVPALLRRSEVRISSPDLPVTGGVAVVAGATLLTMLAVLAPAASAAGVSPLQALRSASTVVARRGIGPARLIAGLLPAGAAVLVARAAYSGVPDPDADPIGYDTARTLLEIVGSGALAFVALIALGPLLVRPVLALASWPIRRSGTVGRLAVSSVGSTPRRAAAVSLIVALGGTLITGALVGASSLQADTDRVAAVDAPADFLVEPGTAGPAELVAHIRTRVDLAHVTPCRTLDVSIDGRSASASDLDLGALPALNALRAAAGTLDSPGQGGVILTSTLAHVLDRRIGNTVRLQSPKGSVEVRITGTLPGKGPLGAEIIADRSTLDALGSAATPSTVLADAVGDLETARRGLVTAVRTTPGARLNVLADQRDSFNADLSGLFAAALGLLGLTVLISVVGVGTTTALSVTERTREFGLLRALGLSRAGMHGMLTAEASLYGVLGASIGIPLGIGYGGLAVVALRRPTPLQVPTGHLLALALALVAVTALAGWLPARRATRVSPVAALGLDE